MDEKTGKDKPEKKPIREIPESDPTLGEGDALFDGCEAWDPFDEDWDLPPNQTNPTKPRTSNGVQAEKKQRRASRRGLRGAASKQYAERMQ